jgi:RNA polymerase sigma factor (sigma-70 family)
MDEPITWDQLHALMDELRAMARALLALEGNARSLHQPTALVLSALRRQVPGGTDRNEVNWNEVTWPNRRYFFGAMHAAMWRALRDHARKRKKKRGLRTVQVEEIHLENLARTAEERPEQIEALRMALERLGEQRPEWAGLIEHHYLSGYMWEEVARAMGVSERTARRDGERARLLLHREILKILNKEDIPPEGPHGAAADEKPIGASLGTRGPTPARIRDAEKGRATG